MKKRIWIRIIALLVSGAGIVRNAPGSAIIPPNRYVLRPLSMLERENWLKALDYLLAQADFLKHEVVNCVTAWGMVWTTELDKANLTDDSIIMGCQNMYEEICELLDKWEYEVDKSSPREEFQKILNEGGEISKKIESFYNSIAGLGDYIDSKRADIPPDIYPSLKNSMQLVIRLNELAALSTKAFMQYQGCDMVGKPEPIDLRTNIGISEQYFTTVSEHRGILTLRIYQPISGISSVFMDPGICVTLFNNLIRNSCEMAQRHKKTSVTVTIEVKPNPLTGGVIVEYRDDGPGFVDREGRPLEDPKVVLSAGFTTRSDSNNYGHGIGLSIVETQLREARASIRPYTNPSRPGANFEIRFPPCAPTMANFIAHAGRLQLSYESI